MPASNGCMQIAFPHVGEPNQSINLLQFSWFLIKQHLEMKMKTLGAGKYINIVQLTLQALKEF